MENSPKQEPALEEQINLARALNEAVDKRNALTERYPDWDDLIVFVNSDPENRAHYEGLEQVANEARARFDKMVIDKKALVEHLRKTGEDKLADRIAMMFSVRLRTNSKSLKKLPSKMGEGFVGSRRRYPLRIKLRRVEFLNYISQILPTQITNDRIISVYR
jgi:hypothetical protein